VGRLGVSMYLVCHYRSAGGSCICRNHHTAVKQAAHNGRSGARRLWEWDTLGVEGRIAVVVGEVEAAHGGFV
jgi:hypothetical protein